MPGVNHAVWRIAAAGSYAYFAQQGNGLRVADATDPARPAAVPGGRGYRMIHWTDGQKDYLDQSRRLAHRLQQELDRLWGTRGDPLAVPRARVRTSTTSVKSRRRIR